MPENNDEPDFAKLLGDLQKLGFTGVELNITNPEEIDTKELKKLLTGFGLKMTMFATGALAKKEGLSLSSEDEEISTRAI